MLTSFTDIEIFEENKNDSSYKLIEMYLLHTLALVNQ